jgi:RNA recognition motif-containing protein
MCSCCQLPEAAEMVEEQVQDDVVMRKLFIRGLANEATKEHVQEFFERYGNVSAIRSETDVCLAIRC